MELGKAYAKTLSAGDGVFQPSIIADVLNEGSEYLRKGFEDGVFNNRGDVTRGIDEGGEQEYVLANTYNEWAKNYENSHLNLARSFRNLGKIYSSLGDYEGKLSLSMRYGSLNQF